MSNKPTFDIDAMCSILKRQGIESSEYTDCTILYSVTFEQLRNLFTEGFNTGTIELEITTEQSSKEIERLNALVAMKDEALKTCREYWVESSEGNYREKTFDVHKVKEALSASSSTVAKWEAEKLLPLQRQVAMLNEFVNHCLNAVDNLNDLPISDEWATKWANKASCMLEKHNHYRDELATAEAYDREHAIKSAGEFKALLLESTKVFAHPHIEGVFAVYEERLRAANKKEGE